MFDKMVQVLVKPIENLLSEYVVLIDGIQYLPFDDFLVVYAATCDLICDMFIKASAFCSVFIFALGSGVAVSIFISKALTYRKKAIKE